MTPRRCLLDIDFDTLSAWHSRLLPAPDAQRLAAHIPTCAACQAQVGAIARVGDLLRAQRVPPAGADIWRGVHQTLSLRSNTPMNTRKSLALTGISAAGILVILFAVIFVMFSGNGPSHPITVSPSVTATTLVKVTPTDGPTYVPDANGWHTVPSLNYGKWIAFAPSAGQTGYVCGNTATGTTLAPVQVGVTHDGGTTWENAATLPFTANACHIDIDPYNPQDVVVENLVSSCDTCPDSFIYQYRSQDGASSWTRITLPPGNEQTIQNPVLKPPVWTPTAMYSAIASNLGSGANTSTQLGHIVAVSANGGPLAWTTANPFAGDQFLQQQFMLMGISYAFADGATYGLAVRNTQVPGYTYVTTPDAGVTWKEIAGNFNIQTIQTTYSPRGLLANGTDSLNNHRPLLFMSHPALLDTWQQVPAFPSATFSLNNFFAAPDGSIFAAGGDGMATYYVSLLSPNSATWGQAAVYVFQQMPIAVSTDAAGHPLKLWSIRVYDNAGNPQPNPLPQIQYLSLTH